MEVEDPKVYALRSIPDENLLSIDPIPDQRTDVL